MSDISDQDPENVFKILVATDVHLGYGESFPHRENDTFVTFQEVLEIAEREEVDFVLLGGDLFHEARPSPYCVKKCTELIRRHCFGDKPVKIELLSDSATNFQAGINGLVNYEDPNINISIPIFSIHGNHDDPVGKRQVSTMDLMATSGLINYFGRWNDLSQVDIEPILLAKGDTQLALYGLSHIRDERLARLFLEKKVTMKTYEDSENFFNLLVLHQNRYQRGVKNYIPETAIPNFLDLVVWGHEHDCRIDPVIMENGHTQMSQPGSTVATSLSEGESAAKHVALLKIYKKQFQMIPIALRTVRPFIFKQIALDPPEGLTNKVSHADKAQAYIERIVGQCIEEAKELDRLEDLLPLVRLNVTYSDERQLFNAIRFGQKFVNIVANPEDMLKFAISERSSRARGRLTGQSNDRDFGGAVSIEDFIQKLVDSKKLQILSLNGLNAAIKKCIDSNDNDAVSDIIRYQEEETLKKLKESRPDETEVDNNLERLRNARARDTDEFTQYLNKADRVRARPQQADAETISLDSDDDDLSTSAASSTATKPRGRAPKGGRATATRRAPRARK